MKFFKSLANLSFFLCASLCHLTSTAQVKVSIIGDSNTASYGIPQRVQATLGSGFTVINRGNGGKCLRSSCDAPYMNTTTYQSALADLPEYYVVILGTNDGRTSSWSNPTIAEPDFKTTYAQLMSQLRAVSTKPIVITVTPPRVAAAGGAGGQTDALVTGTISPLLKSVAAIANSPVVDLNSQIDPLTDLLSDGVHINDSGATKFGLAIRNAICRNPRSAIMCPPVLNFAPFGSATQSSTYGGASALRGIDGNTSGLYSSSSVTHTNLDAQPWWQVDLGAIRTISTIKFWPRNDNATAWQRNANMYILTSKLPFTSNNLATELLRPDVIAYSYPTPSPTQTVISVATASKEMRFVRVWLNATQYLSVGELELFE